MLRVPVQTFRAVSTNPFAMDCILECGHYNKTIEAEFVKDQPDEDMLSIEVAVPATDM